MRTLGVGGSPYVSMWITISSDMEAGDTHDIVRTKVKGKRASKCGRLLFK